VTEQQTASKVLALLFTAVIGSAVTGAFFGSLSFLWSIVLVVAVALSVFLGFWAGIVYGAPAWREWAREEQAKRKAANG
jgi:DMSO reductase anchor subunit